MMNDLLKEGYDNEEYTENVMTEEKSCCQVKKEGSTGCGCRESGIPIKK